MNEVKLPWGLATDGRMISVDAVESGLACACVCPACERPLVAAKGEIYQHHFRHQAEQAICLQAGESALHRYAKQLICQTLQLGYPRWHRGYQEKMYPVGLGAMRAAAEEVDLYDSGIRTDVYAEFEAESIAVEIFVAHRVDANKVQRFAHYGIAAIEIDLHLHRYARKSEAEWQEIILHKAPRYWLFPPKETRDAEDVVRQQWVEQQREREAFARALQARMEEERLHQENLLKAMNKADARRREQQQLIAEAQARERAAERRALDERERVKRAEERLKFAAQAAALKQQREREREGPNLQALVLAHGSYDQIPDEAWAEHEVATALWRDRLLGLAPVFDADPANAFPLRRCNTSGIYQDCIVCSRPAAFGYRQPDGMKWFCGDHRLADWWADARQ